MNQDRNSTQCVTDSKLVKNDQSPYAKLRSVNLADVQWTRGFWADRFARAKNVSLPHLWKLAADPKTGHSLENFRIAAGLTDGEFHGTDWQDAWVHKWIESACYLYANEPDESLIQQMDDIIAIVAKAQADDGYIATQGLLRKTYRRFGDKKRHELYVMGHMLTAAGVHHRITGQRNYLDVAIKCADYLHKTFSDDTNLTLKNCPVNPSIIMGSVELYRVTGEKRYLELANIFIDNRGKDWEKRQQRDEDNGILKGGSHLNQDRVPLREEDQVVGHAVFYTYLFAGATDAYMETGDATLLTALERLWTDLTERKMYITGGVSAIHSAHPTRLVEGGILELHNLDSVHESVGMPWELPNDTAYNETCGQIGCIMWNWRMLLATGEARFADIMEQCLYNATISGINLSGQGWSYTNPLRWHGPKHLLLSQDEHQRFDPGHIHICCPTNLLRTELSWNGCLYATSDEGLWIHHYGNNVFEGTLANGRKLKLTQQSDYPWDGQIRLTVEHVEKTDAFGIALRIPSWANDATLKINGSDANVPCQPNSYAVVSRQWATGDTLELVLPMPVRLMGANPRVESSRRQVAVLRGPIVYCMESIDLPQDIAFEDVVLPRDAKWDVHHDKNLLGGVNVLQTQALVLDSPKMEGALYQPLTATEPKTFTLKMIPYYAWNNRGEPKMTVWLGLR